MQTMGFFVDFVLFATGTVKIWICEFFKPKYCLLDGVSPFFKKSARSFGVSSVLNSFVKVNIAF
jgi:hypothetical protein